MNRFEAAVLAVVWGVIVLIATTILIVPEAVFAGIAEYRKIRDAARRAP